VGLDRPLALQAIGEFQAAATQKLKLSVVFSARKRPAAPEELRHFARTASAIRTALDASAEGSFSFWDAVLLASAAEAGCSVLFSKDRRDGARLGSIVISNPFGARPALSEFARELLR